jgi:hypothetical protein
MVGVRLFGDLQSALAQDPANPSIPVRLGAVLVVVHLMSVCSEDIVFASAEVGVDLSRKDGILRHVRLPRVVVEREE